MSITLEKITPDTIEARFEGWPLQKAVTSRLLTMEDRMIEHIVTKEARPKWLIRLVDPFGKKRRWKMKLLRLSLRSEIRSMVTEVYQGKRRLGGFERTEGMAGREYIITLKLLK